jgi:hypothetical protein
MSERPPQRDSQDIRVCSKADRRDLAAVSPLCKKRESEGFQEDRLEDSLQAAGTRVLSLGLVPLWFFYLLLTSSSWAALACFCKT